MSLDRKNPILHRNLAFTSKNKSYGVNGGGYANRGKLTRLPTDDNKEWFFNEHYIYPNFSDIKQNEIIKLFKYDDDTDTIQFIDANFLGENNPLEVLYETLKAHPDDIFYG